LRLEGLEKPYFLAYRVEERRNQRVAATFGSVVAQGTTRGRSLRVEVRVGSPALDNTNFVAAGTYSVWTEPGPDVWTVIFNRTATAWHTRYPAGQDVLRVRVTPFLP
jgi:hypothetical protein